MRFLLYLKEKGLIMMNIENIQEELKKSWVDAVSWECLDLKNNLDVFFGKYAVNLSETISSDAPHKLILHGTDTNIIAMYQSVIHSLFAIKNGLFKANNLKNDVAFPEIRRRIVIVKTQMSFKKPIYSNLVTLESKIENQAERGLLFFYNIHVNIGEGSQFIENTFCLNFRDDLI